MILEITSDHIGRLSDADLRELIGRLCAQEVRSKGFSAAAVTWGGHQNAADGGIDVRVSLPSGSAIDGYVPNPVTGLQVKAQDLPKTKIREEMAPGGVLRLSIAELVNSGGAYIIVSSHGSTSDSVLKQRRDAMAEVIAEKLTGKTLAVDFYDRQRVANWVNERPGLVAWVRLKIGQPSFGWRPFADWSSSPTSLDQPYLLDDRVRLLSPSIKNVDGVTLADGVDQLRRILEKPKGTVRLVGLSGVGKTRLVQALFDDRLGANALPQDDALYTDLSDGPNPVPLEKASQLLSLGSKAILIVDNCGIELHRKLAALVSNSNGGLSVITIEYDISDDEPENTDVFKLEASSVDLIERILEARYPALPPPSRTIIAQFSDGNARIAFALAATAKNGESLVNMRDTELFKRLFEQQKGASENLLNAAKACALLYSFDGVTLDGQSSELARLANLLGITAGQLFGHVAELSRRKLVQHRGQWRAILPHAIAHRLCRLALEDIPFQKIEAQIVNGGSERMLRSFSKRMGYLHDDPRAAALVAQWFSEGGFLEPLGNYNELGKALFVNVAPIDPEATLEFIERAAAKDTWSFGSENGNRREIVRVLRSIAYDAALFNRAVSLLVSFALSEGNERSDSAKETLKSLFFLYLSGTHASAAQRADVIRTLLEEDPDSETALGLELLRAMLECGHFSSHHSFDFGARSRDYGAHPREPEEFLEWYGQAIRIIKEGGSSNRKNADALRKLFASRFSELVRRIGMLDELVGVAYRFAHLSVSWTEGWIAARSALRKCKGKAESADVEKLEALAERLRPTSMADLVRSYALTKDWGPFDIAALDEMEDDDPEPSPSEAHARIYELCIDLGRQLGKEKKQFEDLLPEIFASSSYKTVALGKGVAEGCESLRDCWRTLIERFLERPDSSRFSGMLAGFLAGAPTRDPQAADEFLDFVLSDKRVHPYLVDCQVTAELGSKGAARLIAAAGLESVPVHTFAVLSAGRSNEKLSDEEIRQVLMALSARGGLHVAVEILGMRIFASRSDKQSIGEAVKATGRDLLTHVQFERGEQRFDHMLGDIIEVCLDRPEHEELARHICRQIFDAVSTYKISPWDVGDITEGLAKTFPIAVLDILVERANSDEEISRTIFRDLRENRACALQAVPDAVLQAWAEQRPESRYIDLAQVVRFSESNDDDKSLCWSATAQMIIDSAPDPASVLDIFLDRFHPMSWSGSRAHIMGTRIPLLETLTQHQNPAVASWARGALTKFAEFVERQKASEAKESRMRDERFE